MNTDCYCLWCGRGIRENSTLWSMFEVTDVICESCRQKMNYHPVTIRTNGLKIRSLYCYEGVTREMIIRYKELFDEALNPVFLYPYIREISRKYRGYVMVPVPSSDVNNKERGFRAVDELFANLNLPIANVLYKKTDFDQKKAGFRQRKEIGKHLGIRNRELIEGKKVLLVDDVITSGATMRECHKLIAADCRKVKGLVISYNRRLVKKSSILRSD